MPVLPGEGDFLDTTAQTIAFGYNVRGRTESGMVETALMLRYPVAFAAFRRQARAGRLDTGRVWVWQEATTQLAFLIIRETPVGATRLRTVQQAFMTLARDSAVLNIREVALAPLGNGWERDEIQRLVMQSFERSSLLVWHYR